MEQDEGTAPIPSRYKYEGRRLTPRIMAEIARAVVHEQTFQRSALERTLEYHLARGGAPTNTDIKVLTSKAMSELVRAGLVVQAGKAGWWRWREGVNGHVELQGLADSNADWDVAAGEGIDLTNEGPDDGEGSGRVYVYYFPSYKELALRKEEARWPVKIGMTASSDSYFRVTQQQGTAMPEVPVIAYQRRTDVPYRLEQGLHSILYLRGLQLDNAPGAEWFLSNPEEIKEIVDWVYGPGHEQREPA